MSKLLTVEELKSLSVGDYVWIVGESPEGYYRKDSLSNDMGFAAGTIGMGFYRKYADYGIEWWAYENEP